LTFAIRTGPIFDRNLCRGILLTNE
jgi:hypothetical protein